MSSKRAKRHHWLVANQKAVRYVRRYKSEWHDGIYHYYNSHKISGPRWRAINRVQTVQEYVAMKLINGYGFTREETEQAIKILGLETGRRKA